MCKNYFVFPHDETVEIGIKYIKTDNRLQAIGWGSKNAISQKIGCNISAPDYLIFNILVGNLLVIMSCRYKNSKDKIL